MPRVLLAVGGGIAAYKCATLCSRLVQNGIETRVMFSRGAEHFVGAATFAALSSHPVIRDGFDPSYPLGSHIEAADNIDLLVVAPCTANLLGKLAHGIADDVVTTTYLQNTAPVLLAPAMSHAMWVKAAVQRNLTQLQHDGCHVVGPESGWLSCRVKGEGRMSEPETILNHVLEHLGVSRRRKDQDQD